MKAKQYIAVSGIVFGLVALAHLWRLVEQIPIQLDSAILPMELSWLGLPLAGGLCVWAVFLLRARD